MSISKTPEHLLMELGERLKYCRVKKYGKGRGSLKKCAEELGTSPQNWNDYEAGRRELGFGKIILFAGFFDVAPTWLLTGNTHEVTLETFYLTSSISDLINTIKIVMFDFLHGHLSIEQAASVLSAGSFAMRGKLSEMSPKYAHLNPSSDYDPEEVPAPAPDEDDDE